MKSIYVRAITAAVISSLALPVFSMQTSDKISNKTSSHWINLESGHWFLAGAAGFQKPIVDKQYTIPNGSAYAPPANVDSYSTNINNTGTFNIEGGYRFVRNKSFIPAWALGMRYAHSFEKNIGGKITQYSLPDFTNYNYNWDIYSDTFMVLAKFDLFQWRNILPYFSIGTGAAYNTAAHYKEYALIGIDARESPNYARNTKAQLTYSLGLGLDWHIKPVLLIFFGYEHQNLGTLSSGSGINTWASNYLKSGSYKTNSVMLGATWLLS